MTAILRSSSDTCTSADTLADDTLADINPSMDLCELLDYRAWHQSDQLAYQYLRRGQTVEAQLTYRQLQVQVRAVASRLRAIGATGKRALLLFSPGLDFVSAFLGCLYAGVTAVPAYPPRKNKKVLRLQAIVEDADIAAVLTTHDLAQKIRGWLETAAFSSGIDCLRVDDIVKDAATQAMQALSPVEHSLSLLQYTSGSTGTPKGVMVSHENLMHNLAAIYRCFGHSEQSRGVIWLPPYHDMGLIGGVLQPLYGGFPVTLMSPVDFLQKPLRWLKAISQHRATTSGGPDFAYDLCARKAETLLAREDGAHQLADLDLSCWEVAFTGAEPVRSETLDRFSRIFSPYGFRKTAFYPCYGMAETTLIASGGEVGALPAVETLAAGGYPLERSIVSCGTSLSDQRLIVVNPDTLTCCKEGKVGEIWVSGKSVTQGYWRDPDKTAQHFQAYLAETDAVETEVGTEVGTERGPFLRTGDLGFLRNRELFVTGRIKDMMIIRGQNFYPQDIERTVEESHEALKAGGSAAFSVEWKGRERLVVVSEVERTYLRQLAVEAVMSNIRQAITAMYDLQVSASLLIKPGSLPRTSSGKVQRYRCRELFLAGDLAVVNDWSESPQHRRAFVKIHSEVDAILQTIKPNA